jgi:hypothetical protein
MVCFVLLIEVPLTALGVDLPASLVVLVQPQRAVNHGVVQPEKGVKASVLGEPAIMK